VLAQLHGLTKRVRAQQISAISCSTTAAGRRYSGMPTASIPPGTGKRSKTVER